MSWLIRPLQRTDDHRWSMTALNIGAPVTDGMVTVHEAGELVADSSHTHDSEESCEQCNECASWAKLFKAQ